MSPQAPLAFLLVFAAGAALAADPNLTVAPCEVPGVKGKARCGTYRVYEDRAKRAGRTLDLGFVVLEATGVEPAKDPLVFINGGPGGASTDAAAGLAFVLAGIREKHDLLFVDLRGTGRSGALSCPLYGDPPSLQKVLGDYFPPDGVEACRASLERKANLTLYTTDSAVDDIDDVRAALGYDTLNLYGGSYGSRVALVYMRRHPKHVRTAILHGVAPPPVPLPLRFPRDAQNALDGILGECDAEPGCHAAFPALRDELKQTLEVLDKGAVDATVLHPVTGAIEKVQLSYDLGAEALRQMLYEPSSASLIPVVIHAAAAKQWTPLAESAILARRSLIGGLAQGLYLSVTCAEDLPYIAPGVGEKAAEGTFLRDYRLQQQRRACRLWPRATLENGFHEAVRSATPVLTMAGQWDPVTPPSQALEALRTLPNGVPIVVPSGGHVFMGLQGIDCTVRIMTDFVTTGASKGVDTSCLGSIKRPPFPTSMPEMAPVDLPAAQRDRLVGRYADPKSGFSAEIALKGDALELSVTSQAPTRVVPVSPTRLRVVGDPAMSIAFEMDGETVKSLAIEQSGAVLMTLPKTLR